MRATSPLLAALAVVAVVALGLGLDRLVPLGSQAPSEPVAAGTATSGAWYCAAGGAGAGSGLLLITAAPPSDVSTPGETVTTSVTDGEVEVLRRGNVFASSANLDRLTGGAEAIGLATRWWDLPVAVTRYWDVRSEAGVSGVVSGPCVAQPSDTWIVPGLATAGGAQADVHLANPFDSDATVAVTLTTPDGVLAPRRLENVVVPRRSVLRIELNEHAPERADLGVVVETRAGRVVVEAVQSFNAAIGGVEGLALASAAPEPAEVWTIPWFADAEDRQSWLWITNPGERAAAVELTVHTGEGGTVPEGVEEITLPAGSVQRVDLRGLLPAGDAWGGLTVRSENGQPIVASVATQFTAEDATRTGFALELGSVVTDDSWVLSGGPTAEREVEVVLVNPGGDDAVVDLEVWAGAGILRPDDLRGIRVPTGQAVTVTLSEDQLPAAPAYTVFVAAREGLVVAGQVVTTTGEGPLEPVASPGVPIGSTAEGGTLPPIRFDPGMAHRIGTELGPHGAFDPEDLGGDPLDPATPLDDGAAVDPTG